MSESRRIFLGVDVQVRRGCAYMALSEDGEELVAGWLPPGDDAGLAARAMSGVVRELSQGVPGRVVIGVDAPRQPLVQPRAWYWERSRKTWRPRRPAERGAGRHCEVVVAALGLARPQWTPFGPPFGHPAWMRVGFGLFESLGKLGCEVHEVFPSASLTLFEGRPEPRLSFSLSSFRPGKTDMLDALVAAATVREFGEGRGWSAPGGDGLGAIVLPGRPEPAPRGDLLEWPGAPAQ